MGFMEKYAHGSATTVSQNIKKVPSAPAPPWGSDCESSQAFFVFVWRLAFDFRGNLNINQMSKPKLYFRDTAKRWHEVSLNQSKAEVKEKRANNQRRPSVSVAAFLPSLHELSLNLNFLCIDIWLWERGSSSCGSRIVAGAGKVVDF